MLRKYEDMKTDFCLLVNKPALYQAALKAEYYFVICLRNRVMTEAEIKEIQEGCEAVFVLFYPEEGEIEEAVCKQLEAAEVPYISWRINGWDLLGYVDKSTPENMSMCMPEPGEIRKSLIRSGKLAETDYTERCGNCYGLLEAGDKYCRLCGTRRGEGSFKPRFNSMITVYGPPIRSYYVCGRCGNKWSVPALGSGYDTGYCPNCGKKEDAQRIEEDY